MTEGSTLTSASKGRPARRVALAWAALTLGLVAATAPAQGIGRDEGVYLAAAESYAAFWAELSSSPAHAILASDRFFTLNHEHPALAKEVFGLTHALFSKGLGLTNHLQGFRFGAFFFAAFLSFLLATAGYDLAGLLGAWLAPALFWAVPRHFYHAHLAALDLPVTALWLAAVLAYRESERPGISARRAWAFAIATGIAFGAGLAVKHNAWFLGPLLFVHALYTRPSSPGTRRYPVPLALVAMGILGPLVFVASWPWLWHDPIARLQSYFTFHLHHENYSWQYLGHLLREPPFPIEYPFVVTALTVPAAILFVYACGFMQGLACLFRPDPPGIGLTVRARPPGDEILLLLNAFFPLALIAWPTVPHFGGVKHWLPAMPFLALLGARALVTAGRAIWPRRAALVTVTLALFALVPAIWAVAHIHPYGTAAYNELAGGAPGAASLGMERQFWGDDVVGLLGEVNLHAVPGARVWWQETSAGAVRAWQRDGLVRGDLRWAVGPEDADLSIWQYHQEFRDKEFRTWTEFAEPARPDRPPRLPRPVAGLYLDEVPLAVIYARPGAWR